MDNKNFLVEISNELKTNFITYSTTVILQRAIPDIADGFIPVRRRIIYSMFKSKITWSSSFKKSARVVGNVLGFFHPHGDLSVYMSLVKMGQFFSSRYCFVETHGNFGSIDGDPPAAMRYTEVRLSKIAQELVRDIKQNTVRFVNNYDDSEQEPFILPSYLPVLLMNGTHGVAVGLATSIPPHNLSEIMNVALILLDKPEATTEELFQVFHGPDFPLGGEIINTQKELIKIYEEGKGTLKIKAKLSITLENKIIITEIPYRVNKSLLIKKISILLEKKKIEWIKEINDFSTQQGIFIELELKKNTNPKVVLNQLFKKTDLSTTFSCNFNVISYGQPKHLGFKEIVENYVYQQYLFLKKRSRFQLEKVNEKIHLLLGYRKAIDRIQDVIAIVGKSKNYNQASLDLQHFINVDQKQAEAILGLKIKKLTSFEKTNLEKETKTSLALAKRLSSLLKSKNSQKKHLKKRFQKIIDTYSDSRRTTFNYGAKLVQDERAYYQSKKVVLVWDDNNNIKSLPCQNLKVQKRNGIGLNWKISKNKSHKIYTKTIFSTQNLLFFTNQGRVFLIPAFKFLEQNLMRLGISFYHYVDLHSKEQVVAVCNFDFDNNNYDSVFIFSKKGFVWCLDFNRFTKLSLKKPSLRKGFNISGDDEIISATLARKNHKVVLFSDQGRYVIYEAKKFTPRKGICLGLKGLKFKSSFDFITSAAAFDSNKYDKFLVVTKSGYGRLITINQLRVLTLRPAQGSNLVAKTEKALDIVPVSSKVKNNMISFTNGNKVICSPVALIPEVKSRSGKGVKIIKLTYGQHLIKVAVV